MSPQEAYSIEKRLSDMRREVRRAYEDHRLHILRPGYLAGTFGVSKDAVKLEIRKLSELLSGDGK